MFPMPLIEATNSIGKAQAVAALPSHRDCMRGNDFQSRVQLAYSTTTNTATSRLTSIGSHHH